MTVIGVIPDIQMESPFRPISPLTIIFNKDWVGFVNIRMNPKMSASAAIKRIQPIFDRYNPAFPFIYRFADTEYAKKFNYEELVGNLAAIIAVIAIFISCLGLIWPGFFYRRATRQGNRCAKSTGRQRTQSLAIAF